MFKAKKYVEEKTQHVNDRIQRGEDADDGSYLAHLIAEGKLSNEQIYSNMTELLAASIDTVSYDPLLLSSEHSHAHISAIDSKHTLT